MQRYSDIVTDKSGNVLQGASVLVRLLDGGTPALYALNGNTLLDNPLITDALGRFAFYAADGRYSLAVSIGGVLYATQSDVLLEDPADESLARINGGSIKNVSMSGVTITDAVSLEINGGTITNAVLQDVTFVDVTLDTLDTLVVNTIETASNIPVSFPDGISAASVAVNGINLSGSEGVGLVGNAADARDVAAYKAALAASDGVLLVGNAADKRDVVVSTMAFSKYTSRGEWLTATPYVPEDIYIASSIAYVVTLAHTSTTVAADLSAEKVALHQAATKQDLEAPTGAALIGSVSSGTGAVQRTVQSKLHDVVSVKDFGAKGDGATDDTAAIQSALNAVSGSAYGLEIYFPAGIYLVSSALIISTVAGFGTKISGAGRGRTVIKRHQGFPAGDIFFANTVSNAPSSWLEIADLMIVNANNARNTSGYAIHILNRTHVHLQNIYIYDGFGGVKVEGSCTHIFMNSVFYFQSGFYSQTWGQSESGFHFIGRSAAIFLNDCYAVGEITTTTDVLQHGIYIAGADGMQITNSAFNGVYGVMFAGGNGYQIDDVFFSNCIVDGVRDYGVYMQGNNSPAPYMNIRFADCHINARVDSGKDTIGVMIEGDCDYVQFIGCNINESGSHGVKVLFTVNWKGAPRQSIKFNGCAIVGNNRNSVNASNVYLGLDVTGVSLVDCDMSNQKNYLGSTNHGLALIGSNSNIRVVGCNLRENYMGPIYFGSAPTLAVIRDNSGIDDVIYTLESAALLTMLAFDTVLLRGGVTVTTINGGWVGRKVSFFCTDSPINFGEGGNIYGNKIVPVNCGITFLYDGSTWRPV